MSALPTYKSYKKKGDATVAAVQHVDMGNAKAFHVTTARFLPTFC